MIFVSSKLLVGKRFGRLLNEFGRWDISFALMNFLLYLLSTLDRKG